METPRPVDSLSNTPVSWRPSREDMVLLLEASGEALFVTDRQGVILSLNPVAQLLVGRMNDVVGQSLHRIIRCCRQGEAGDSHCPLERAIVTGEVSTIGSHQWMRDDGTVQEIAAMFWPRQQGTERSGALVCCRDLTAKQEAERELQRVARLAEDAPSPIVEFDDSGTMLYANTAMVEWMNAWGAQLGEIEAVFPPDVAGIIQRCLDQKAPSGRIDHAVGQRTLAWSFFPMEHVRQVRGYAVDVTAEKLLERAKEVAEESARAKSIFLATMSHELRTPMNGVLGCTQLLQESVLSQDQRSLLSTMQRSAEVLLALVNDILDFSKIEADKMTLEVADVDLPSLVGDVMTLVAELAKKKGLELTHSIAGDVPSLLRGDPVRLRQILFNLVGNAIKFTEQGSVRIDVTRAQAEEQESDAITLSWSITDTGIGMTEGQIARMFQAYSQADVSTARRFGGTGLGLMICRNLVGLMGGDIAVQSQSGKGSTFQYQTRLFPAIRRESSLPLEKQAGVLQPADPLRLRVLVADDNEINQVVACKFLQKLGCQVEVVRNGREALESVTRASYDAVLMDCEMPELNGYEATTAIRAAERDPSARLPIIALTGHASPDQVDLCRQAGMDEVITKPVTLAALRQVLSQVAGSSLSM